MDDAPRQPAEETADEAAERRAKVADEGSPFLVDERERFTLSKALGMVGTLFLVVALPLAVTTAVGVFQMTKPDKLLSGRTPKDLGLSYEDVTLHAADGVDIAGWYVRAARPTGAAVLALHGYPADKGDVLPRVAFLADRYDLLLIDFRSFGESGGAYTTMGPKEVADAEAGLAYLRDKGASRVGVYGFSMGGAVALMSLGRERPPDAVVAEASYADLWSVVEEPYRYLGPLKVACAWATSLAARLAGIDFGRDAPVAAVAGTKRPVLLIQAKDDPVVPFAEAEALQKALAGDPAAETWFPDKGGHGQPSTEFPARVQDFFDRNLTPTTP